MLAIKTSYSHSHAYQVCPAMVAENGSTRVTECVCNISCPLRMCHPVPASRSKRRPIAPQLKPRSNATKSKSETEGIKKRTQRDTLERCAPGLCIGSVCGSFECKACARVIGPCYPIETWKCQRAWSVEITDDIANSRARLACDEAGCAEDLPQ